MVPRTHFCNKKFSVVGGWWVVGGWKSDFNVCSRPFDWCISIFNVSSRLLTDEMTWDWVRGLALDNKIDVSKFSVRSVKLS